MQKTRKSRYTVNLPSMHSVCEINYARLCRLFADYEKSNKADFFVGTVRVCIEVVERSRYTTIFRINQAGTSENWITGLRLEVRAYHDASMAEVHSFCASKHLAARYSYPNHNMYQEDEKNQQNIFLADWLKNCLMNGRRTLD